ncbi:MAG TPA: hypothetical protein PKD85_17090 [Saprospiraceae bacterium]|nr:hypothetical protein [Saprospiraceae bacterium]
MEKLKIRLSELTPEYQVILDALSQTTILTGGLLLQSMTGLRWDDTDIDILTTDYNLKSFGQKKWTGKLQSLQYTVLPGVINIYSGLFGSTNIKIDIVHVKSFDEFFNGIDFDFCKIWCDGVDVYALNINSVETKTCKINKKEWQITKGRISKYKARGFTIL